MNLNANPATAGSGSDAYAMSREEIVIARLEDQIDWYDRKSRSSQGWFKHLKVVSIAAAALIPALTVGGISAWAAAALGVVIIVAEGVQHLNQFQHNWITYRSTCEALKHEKFMFLAHAGPYLGLENRHALLAERIESLISTEHSKWIAGQRTADRQDKEV